MATYVCGIAASAAVDTAGEAIDIAGLDISSLVGAMMNFEHKSEKSSDYIGKILVAKKIFSPKDCSNEIELRYWNKCEIPFLYCMGILFDDYQSSAKEVAAIFEFDSKNPDLKPSLGFSIEGSKQSKNGHIIDNSIARKLTITATPANKTCLADKVDLDRPKAPADPLLFLFKSTEIELFSEESLQKSMTSIAPKAPKPGLKQAPQNAGSQIGQTQSGKPVMSHEKIHNYNNFSAEDHRNASAIHNDHAKKANLGNDSKTADFHNQKKKLHDQAAAAVERKVHRFQRGVAVQGKQRENKQLVNSVINKATDAGSGLEVQGNKTQGAALQKAKVDSGLSPDQKAKARVGRGNVRYHHNSAKTAKFGAASNQASWEPGHVPHAGKHGQKVTGHPGTHSYMHSYGDYTETSKEGAKEAHNIAMAAIKKPKPKLTKSEWLARAEQEYSNWPQREQFESFMKERMPHLAKGEVQAIGFTLALKKSVDAEKSLETMIGMKKSEEKN